MPGPADLMAHIAARGKEAGQEPTMGKKGAPVGLMAALEARKTAPTPKSETTKSSPSTKPAVSKSTPQVPEGKLFHYDESVQGFLFDFSNSTPRLTRDAHGNEQTDILVPLPPCVYRMTDYTLAKKEPVLLKRCLLKLNVLRCLARECDNLNNLLWHRFCPTTKEYQHRKTHTLEEDELGKARFMELISNCGVFQKVSELLLQRAGQVADVVANVTPSNNNKEEGGGTNKNPYRIPQVKVQGLEDFLQKIEELEPSLKQARDEIEQTQSVSFFPGLGVSSFPTCATLWLWNFYSAGT